MKRIKEFFLLNYETIISGATGGIFSVIAFYCLMR